MKTKDYVINGRRVTVHGHDADHVIGEIISTGKDIVKGAKDILGIKLTKRKFYAYRDDLYSKVAKIYGRDALGKVPGNAFGAFSHKTIKDSPLKDYSKEKRALDDMMMKYFPKVFGSVVPVQTTKDISEEISNEQIQQTHEKQKERTLTLESKSAKVLKPFKPIMKAGVSNAGFVPPENIDALALLFYDKVVKPATQSTYDHCDHLDDVIVDSILHFIATLQAKREAGEPMNKVYTTIADKATQLQEEAGDTGKQIAGQKVGNFVIENAAIIGVGVLIAVIMLAKK